jgi:peptidoglycan/xylan/chitin deacetylase (PgdA/CDA1 family)
MISMHDKETPHSVSNVEPGFYGPHERRAQLPDHYFKLRPFRSLFGTGLPILLYHKMGKAALLDRRKGLFVSRHLLASQLSELAQAGFGFGKLGDTYSAREIVISFDDGYASCFEHGIGLLEAFGCKAIQFLVSGRIGKTNDWDGTGEAIMDKSQIRNWLAAGHQIGSHTVSHPDLTRLPSRDAREEVQASRKWLEDTFGVSVSHFSYPLGAFNDRIVEIVREAGYSTAVTTQFGVNDVGTEVHTLRRILAYRSLRESFRSLVRWDV